MSDYKGRFTWHELMTTDPDGARSFYGDVVGWETEAWGDGDPPYHLWMNGETAVGGVTELPDEAAAAGAQPHWIPSIGTPDLDATVARAGELEATVLVPPQEIPTVGRFSVLQDPQGAVFTAYTPAGEAPGHDGPPQLGEFSWHELATSDWQAAFDFYSDLFGWVKTDAMDMGEAGTYQMYAKSDSPIPLGGIFNKTPEMPGPPAWTLYAKVPDVHPAVERVKQGGGQVLNGPMEVPGGDMIAQCMDPQGAVFAVHSSVQG